MDNTNSGPKKPSAAYTALENCWDASAVEILQCALLFLSSLGGSTDGNNSEQRQEQLSI